MRRALTLADRRLSFLEGGAGEPLLLVHAFPLTADLWRPQLDAPPAGWRLVAPDLRGFGEASGASPARTVDDHVDDLVELLDALSIEQAVVGGVSMGGYIAFALWRRAPERILGLVLADTRAEPDTDEARAGRGEMQREVREKGATAVADRMVPRLLGAAAQRRTGLVEGVRRMIESASPEAIVNALECLMARPDSVPTLATITCPTLVVVGDEDEITPPAGARSMAAAIAGARLAVIPGAGHLSSLEQPEAFNVEVGAFLGSLGAGRSAGGHA